MNENQAPAEGQSSAQTGSESLSECADLFALPLSWHYSEYGGYDCMSSSYDITDANGDLIASIDLRDIEPDRKNCEYGESKRAEAIAAFFVSCANSVDHEHAV